MKIEPRGKYAGVKVHLDGEEAGLFLEWAEEYHSYPQTKLHPDKDVKVINFASKLGGKIQKLVGEMPNLLEDRTEEQIEKSLKGDAEKIEKQLKAIKKGKDWKKVD